MVSFTGDHFVQGVKVIGNADLHIRPVGESQAFQGKPPGPDSQVKKQGVE